ncbi:MAG: AAA family ATPase [Colwellia sp.]
MDARSICQQTIEQVNSVVMGKQQQVKLALCCMLARGHLLIEDLPGMGKTTLSHALAIATGLSYKRVQFTSDLLPADILGVSIFRQDTHNFEFHEGPIFSQLVLTDEINRASPKTQSALLEAMEERQVSIDGHTKHLPDPFFVIATQNPLHQSGTFPLPESQLDRFLIRIELGFPSIAAEKQMLKEDKKLSLNQIKPCMTPATLLDLQKQVDNVGANDELLDYLLKLVNESRVNTAFSKPLSPRASKGILQAAKAWALIHDRGYVNADDVQAVFSAIAEHRLSSGIISSQASLSEKLLRLVEPI